jgi:D-glycero-alpha-D-manno-heptose-7-phosphate kinase
MRWHPCDDVPDAGRPRTLRATAPVRVCDLGGWTDTWFAGPGRVLNVAVLPGVEARVRVGGPRRVVLDVRDFADRYELAPDGPLPGRHPLLEAAVASTPLPDGVGLEIAVWSDVPAGASLGTSAAAVVALLAVLEALTPGRSTAGALARAAHGVETEAAGRESGVQDQLAAAYGGISWIEVDDYPHASVQRLWNRVPADARAALGAELVVVLLGRGHDSSAVHQQVIDARDHARFDPLRRAAAAGRDALLAGDLDAFAAACEANTTAQAQLHPELVGTRARWALDVGSAHGLRGGKVNGAGGDGGSVTLLARPGSDRAGCTRALAAAGFSVLAAVPTEWGVRVREEREPEPGDAGGGR